MLKFEKENHGLREVYHIERKNGCMDFHNVNDNIVI
jgi:hypothetical protein